MAYEKNMETTIMAYIGTTLTGCIRITRMGYRTLPRGSKYPITGYLGLG